jgi:hypothetical protein
MKARRTEPAMPLTAELAAILVSGPWSVHKTLLDLPPHDDLRALWREHGAALKQAHPRRRLWFEDRDFFVRAVRGEP